GGCRHRAQWPEPPGSAPFIAAAFSALAFRPSRRPALGGVPESLFLLTEKNIGRPGRLQGGRDAPLLTGRGAAQALLHGHDLGPQAALAAEGGRGLGGEACCRAPRAPKAAGAAGSRLCFAGADGGPWPRGAVRARLDGGARGPPEEAHLPGTRPLRWDHASLG